MRLGRLLLLAVGLLSLPAAHAQGTTPVAFWDFAQGTQGWSTNDMIARARTTPEGLIMDVKAPDPNLTGPPVDYPDRQFVLVTVRMRSTGDALGQLYYGTAFSEGNSRGFVVKNDGQWHEYRIPLPPLGTGFRLRLDPSHEAGTVALAWIRVETSLEPLREPWASPRELRGKKFLGGGQFGTTGGETAVTSRYLAKHPTFIASFPYDGYVVPAVIDAEWGEKLGLPRRDYFLHELIWNTVELPYEAIAPIVADLNSVRWGGVTDNFLNYTMTDGARGRFTPDLSNDSEWAILERNAAMAALLCREAKLQGFWLDTEQYGNYRWRTATGVPEFDTNRPANLKFPLGKDTPDVLRRRGAQWIKAVQAQYPPVKILITFAWSPDANEYGPLQGCAAFLDGVLDAIEEPGQLIHGYENTFYYGQGPGTLNAANDGKQDGFPGDRGRYEAARVSIREWRTLSGNPKKYDAFVKVGMAAWVEDDPWGLYPGWPSGSKASFWSNLPLALAYSDEYVWVWSEHTKYGQDLDTAVNPFLASLRNQTFNTGNEAVTTLTEDFITDPLQQGWYFDFDMLAIGRKMDPAHEVPLMSTNAVPYAWSKESEAVRIMGSWPTGPQGRFLVPANGQRRRYVHPIQPVSHDESFRAELDFRIESFGERSDNPIVLGFFCADRPVEQQSLTLQIAAPDRVRVVLAAAGKPHAFPLSTPGGLKTGQPYRVTFNYDGATGRFQASLSDRSSESSPVVATQETVPNSMDPSEWNELGIALWETAPDHISPGEAYRYRLERVNFHR